MRISSVISFVFVSILVKLRSLNWLIVLLFCVIAGFGIAMLYSAAGGSWEPWAMTHAKRVVIAVGLMIFIAMIDVRRWMPLVYYAYFGSLVLLILVEFIGVERKGAQRWLDLEVITLQPSELMKIFLIFALAKFFHKLTYYQIKTTFIVCISGLLILFPVALIFLQPDLGTAILITLVAGVVLFVAGIRRFWFIVGLIMFLFVIILLFFIILLSLTPVIEDILKHFLEDYQIHRIYGFLDPESEPLGAGYNILQSLIAIGSGGLDGKGFLLGTQNQLSFVPERHTDFIFAILSEELGLIGGVGLLFLYCVLIFWGFYVSRRAEGPEGHFVKLLGIGLTGLIFVYVFANIAMVTGLIPVVGIPLPLVSYGGTSLLSFSVIIGLLLSISLHRKSNLWVR